MPAIPKHRKPIVDAAVKLFRRKGYARTGLNEIAEESGAPKGSLYHYFPKGKLSIGAAAVEEAGERIVSTVNEIAARTSSTADLLIEHAKLLAHWMRKSRYRDGCPITTVLLEMAPEDRAISDAGRKAYAARISIISDQLMRDGYSKNEAERLSLLCVSALQGALIQSRVELSGKPIEITAAELGALLSRTK